MSANAGDQPISAKVKLAVGAIGIVFGDIGTSPIYAFRETFVGPHPLAIDDLHIFGVISLIFWSMMLIVSVQYVGILMSADNKGQGGTLALVALISRKLGRARYGWLTVMLGVFATALFYGDSMITPAISVLSAVEGLTVVDDRMADLVIPIALVLLVGLFLLQRRGTTKVGTLFAPIMLAYFITLAVLGVMHIVQIDSKLLAALGAKTPAPQINMSATTKADVLAALRQSLEYGQAVLKEFDDAGLLERVNGVFLGPSASRVRLINFSMAHSQDVYGQLVVSLRLNGVIPPARNPA